MGPLVSIVIPTYNRCKMLGGAIASCLAQTHRNVEVIVVDDGSPDATQEVVAQFVTQDSRVRCVRQQNQKLPAALNAGHRAARGEYLTWLSDDNRFDPPAIEIMLRHLEAHSETGLVYCDARAVDAKGNVIKHFRYAEPDKLSEGCCVGVCFLYRREVYERVGEYDTGLFLAEDYDYWLRVSKQFRIDHLAGIAPYAVHCQPDALSATRRPEIELAYAKAQAKNCSSWWRARRLRGGGHYEAAYAYRRRSEFRLAARHLLHSIACWPMARRPYFTLLGLAWRAVASALPASSPAPMLAPATVEAFPPSNSTTP